jgi:hypothetical protein
VNSATPTAFILDAPNLASPSMDAHVIGRKSNYQLTSVRLVYVHVGRQMWVHAQLPIPQSRGALLSADVFLHPRPLTRIDGAKERGGIDEVFMSLWSHRFQPGIWLPFFWVNSGAASGRALPKLQIVGMFGARNVVR